MVKVKFNVTMKTRSHEAVLSAAAIQVLGESGSRGFTHRAVDECAGLPEGTASRYARSREALFMLASTALFALDTESSGRAQQTSAHARLPKSVEEAAQMLVSATQALLAAPIRYRARVELQLESSRSETLRKHFKLSRIAFVDAVSMGLSSLEVSNAGEHADILVTLIDGVLHRNIILGERAFSTALMSQMFDSYLRSLVDGAPFPSSK